MSGSLVTTNLDKNAEGSSVGNWAKAPCLDRRGCGARPSGSGCREMGEGMLIARLHGSPATTANRHEAVTWPLIRPAAGVVPQSAVGRSQSRLAGGSHPVESHTGPEVGDHARERILDGMRHGLALRRQLGLPERLLHGGVQVAERRNILA